LYTVRPKLKKQLSFISGTINDYSVAQTIRNKRIRYPSTKGKGASIYEVSKKETNKQPKQVPIEGLPEAL